MKLSFRTSVYLIKHKANKKGEAPLWVRIKYDQQESQFSTGILVKESQWHPQKCKVVKHKNQVEYNAVIQNCLYKLKKIYSVLVEKNKDISTAEIKNIFLNKHQNDQGIITFYNMTIEKHTAREGKSISSGTINHYKSSRNKLETYIKDKLDKTDFPLKLIDYSFLIRYETHLIAALKNHTNTVYNEMKRLKTLLNDAISHGIIIESPFLKYKMKSEDTERVSLTPVEVKAISKSFDASDYSPKGIAKDWLLFMVYTGLSYSDLNNLRHGDIITTIEGKKVISIKRQKTKQPATIPLFEQSVLIIEKYKRFPENGDSGKLLPEKSNQYLNRTLKDIMRDFKIDKLITCHCARHTHACMAKELGVSIDSISKTLGHANITMTQHYAKISPDRIQNDYQAFGDFFSNNENKTKIS